MLIRTFLMQIKRKQLVGLLLVSFIAIIGVAFSMTGNDEFDYARREILLRRLGHEILLQSGDSVSRVLPVQKISDHEYRISFEQAFTFQPDSLVKTTQRLLNQDPLASDYVVNVLNCTDASVAYGYAISNNKKNDIITCKGRKQPIACYKINIQFKPTRTIDAKDGYLLGALSVLALVGCIFWIPVKRSKPSPDPEPTGIFTLGSMLFDAEKRTLMMQGTSIDLTKTETRVLRMFASSPNEVIERSRLQKEIWEDEGVIVGRSLDMFISKLRKKLEADPSIKITVIRGKGYKLEIMMNDEY
jgi:hypothetical protein